MSKLLETNLGWLDVDDIDVYFYEGLRYLLGSLMWLTSGAQTRLIPETGEGLILRIQNQYSKAQTMVRGPNTRMILSII